jgi:hypothetical protein
MAEIHMKSDDTAYLWIERDESKALLELWALKPQQQLGWIRLDVEGIDILIAKLQQIKREIAERGIG